MTVVTGGVLQLGVGLAWIQFAIGFFLLLFGVRWLAKAMARYAGLKALHDEDREFAETRAELSKGDRRAAWLIAFKGVMLEGLEVWLIVVALSMHGAGWGSSAGAAIAALLVVVPAGICIQAPLRRVPENTIKFVVGAMIVSFGTFWTLEAIGGDDAWPARDWSLPWLVMFFLLGGFAVATFMRARVRQGVA
jgi:uncharacterized membrane protein